MSPVVGEAWDPPWRNAAGGPHHGMTEAAYRRLCARDGHAWTQADVVELQRRVRRVRRA